ncbi:DBP10 [Symbiodinium microadriaticum]|nr:DBP10 [Symbiodinium microadriaticum]
MQSWPAILAGCNVLGIAPTGSGKTLAFCLPMIPHLQHQMPSLKRPTVASPTCLVVVPTRELAIQVAAVVKKFRSSTGITSIAIYGGSDRDQQLETLSDCPHMHVVVATPGRLIDLVATNSLSLDRVTYLVIDEADRMLALGFEEQLTVIGSYIRPDRQALLFTATFPGKLRDVSARWMGGSADGMVGSNDDSNTVIIRVNTVEFRPTGEGSDQPKRDNVKAAGAVGDAPCTDGEQRKNSSPRDTQLDETLCTSSGASTTTASGNTSTSLSLTISRSIEQKVHVCAAHKKPRLLINYVTKIREQEKAAKLRQGGPMIIFCTKIKTVAFVTNFLLKNGVVGVQQLHGQLPQQRREGVLADFKAGKVLTVCATDVAARGIHIKRLKYVVNYDFPGSLEQYCHRVGRTGRREGDQGFSYSLLTRNLAPLAEDLMSLLRSCGQLVEPNLERLVSDYQNGLIDVSAEEEAAEDDGVQADTAAQGGGGDGDCSDDDCSDDGGVE